MKLPEKTDNNSFNLTDEEILNLLNINTSFYCRAVSANLGLTGSELDIIKVNLLLID